ncbi:unnamed protein product [Mytilus edulis]|uniref:HECT domain-containing protein n=1 Tax=Mytilus edulis TaxID=6550 RepID=A0A8S3R6K4_MYTED|nr:unnamed protein product [Mytilus edulis]
MVYHNIFDVNSKCTILGHCNIYKCSEFNSGIYDVISEDISRISNCYLRLITTKVGPGEKGNTCELIYWCRDELEKYDVAVGCVNENDVHWIAIEYLDLDQTGYSSKFCSSCSDDVRATTHTPYLDEYFERQVSKTALEDFNKLTPRMINHLTDMFIKFGVSILPKADTFRQLMVNLARSEIAIKPLFLCTQIRQGILSLHMDSFWSILTTSDLKTLYQNLNPTPQTVVDKLQRDKEDLRPQEANTLYYLKDFVYSLNSDDLVLFLVFITGSDVLPRDDIIVTFNTRSGMLRVPVAHTCGNTLELSTTYETIQDFKREFLLVLHSQEAFQMSMA